MVEQDNGMPSTDALLRFADGIRQLSKGYLLLGQQLAAAAEFIQADMRDNEDKLTAAGHIILSPIINAGNQMCKLSQLANLGDRIGGMDLAQEITGKARSTLYNLVSKGKLPVAKNGGRLQFSESDLRAYTRSPRTIQAIPQEPEFGPPNNA